MASAQNTAGVSSLGGRNIVTISGFGA